MTTAVQRRRGTSTEHATFTGLDGEITVNTTTYTAHIHDGATVGGVPLAKADGSNIVTSSIDINGGTIDGTVIGGTTPAAVTTSSLVATTADINAGTIDNTVIGGSTAAAGSFTTGQFNTSLNVDGTVTADGLTVDGSGVIQLNDTTVYSGSAGSVSQLSLRNFDTTTAYTPAVLDFSARGTTTTSSVWQIGNAGLNSTYAESDFFIKNRTAASTYAQRFLIEGNGDISFYEDTGTTAKFFWDASAERLGLGTATPAGNLHIEQSGTNPYLRITETGNTGIDFGQETNGNGIINLRDSADLRVFTSATERLRIDSAGTLFQGTTSPTLHSSVTGTVFTNGSLLTEAARGADKSLTLAQNVAIDAGNTWAYLSTDEASYYQQYGGNHYFATAASGTAGADATLATKMIILNNGNVGIGTSSVSQRLDVQTSTVNTGMLVYNTNTASGASVPLFLASESDGSTTNVSFENTGAGNMVFRTGATTKAGYGTERLRIDSSGNLTTRQSTGNNFRVIRNGDNSVEVGNYNATDGYQNTAYGSSTHTFYVGTAGAGSVSRAVDIDSSGNLLVGTTDSNPTTGTSEGIALTAAGFIAASNLSDASMALNRITTDGDIAIFKKNGTTVGSIGTNIGNIYIGESDTTLMFVGGTSVIIPTGTNGATRDNAIDLGNAGNRFVDIYATNGTIQTSDRNEKQDIEVLSEAEQRVAVAAKGLLRKFRWKDSVEEKGDDARIHFGIIAQDLQAAFEAEGLDAGRYAMFISSTWTDEETGEERSRMGVRYSELLAFIIAAI